MNTINLKSIKTLYLGTDLRDNFISSNSIKRKEPEQWIKTDFLLNECKIINVINYNFRASITKKRAGSDYASGASENSLSLRPLESWKTLFLHDLI